MVYSFRAGEGLSRNRIALYVVVIALFVFAAASIASYTNSGSSESSSGYLVTKDSSATQSSAGSSAPNGQASKLSGVSRIDDVQNQLDKLKLDINLFSSNLTSCYQSSSDLSNQVQTCNRDTATCKADFLKLTTNKSLGEQTCQTEKTGLQATITGIQLQSEDMNRTLVALTSTYSSLKSDYASLSSNAANNICCKARVDTPSIKFFRVENSKIVCASDTGTSLGC